MLRKVRFSPLRLFQLMKTLFATILQNNDKNEYVVLTNRNVEFFHVPE